MNKNITLQELEDKGYVLMLWHVDDVKNTYNVTDDEAREVLQEVLQSERITGDVFDDIDTRCSIYEYEEVE